MEEMIKKYEIRAKEIEIESSKILDAANQKKEKILAEAKNMAADLMTKGTKKLDEEKSEQIGNIRKSIERQQAAIIKKIDKDISGFEKKALSNVDKAAKLVMQKIDERYREL